MATEKPITVFGRKYRSLTEAYNKLKPEISLRGIWLRIDRGMSPEQAFSTPRLGYGKGAIIPVTINGKAYESVTEAYKDIKPEVSYGTVMQRIQKGASPEEALKNPKEYTLLGLGNNIDYEVTVLGVKYKNLKEAHSVLRPEASLRTVYSRLHSGYSIDEAFSKPVVPKSVIIVMGKYYESIRQAYKELNPEVSYYTVVGRLQKGWPLDEAFTMPKGSEPTVRSDISRTPPKLELERGGPGSGCSIGHPIEVNGTVFKSVMAAYEHYQYKACVSYGTVVERMRKGMPFKQAMVMPNRNGGMWVRGEWFNGAREAIEHYKLDCDVNNVLDRIRRGWTPEQALGLEAPPRSRRGVPNKDKYK